MGWNMWETYRLLLCAGLTWCILATAPRASAQSSDLILCNGRLVRSLDFRNNTRISGAQNAVGSVYQYDDVGDGVDATIEILGFVNGGSLNIIDRDTGLVENFQPEFNTTGTSQARFRISFFEANTSTPIAIDFSAAAIDVDGNRNAPTQVGLRELAEFEDNFVESLRNNPTELVRNKNGNFTAGFTRFESDTDQFAPGIDESAVENIVTVFYTDVTTVDYTIGTVGNGTGTRLTSLSFDCPNLSSPVPESEIDEDFGDAPLLNYGNPIHTLAAGMRLGATNSADTGPFNDPAANGDLADDGITFGSFGQNQSTEITATVVGDDGFLQAWIDWNNDGDFDDTGEQVAKDEEDTDDDGIITLNVTAPLDASTTETFARFRWSTVKELESNTAAGDGEVEDYQIGPIGAAFADLTASKTVEVHDPGNLGLYMTPGNEVLYKITVVNADTSSAAADDVDIVDTLPDNLVFISATTTGFVGGAFGNPDLPAVNQDCAITACIISFEDGTVEVDSTAEIQVVARIK